MSSLVTVMRRKQKKETPTLDETLSKRLTSLHVLFIEVKSLIRSGYNKHKGYDDDFIVYPKKS